MLAVPSRVFGWWHPLATAVGPDLVVVLPPGGDDRPGLGHGFEPVLVETLVAELAVETLDVAVLHRLAGLDEQGKRSVEHVLPS